MDPANMYKQYGMPVPKNLKNPPYGGKPKFVKLAQGDDGQLLPPVVFEDPRSHKAEPGPLGEIHAWGLYPYVDESDAVDLLERTDDLNWPAFDGVMAMMRQMKAQMMYGGPRGLPTPENQFVKALMDRKKQQLKVVDVTTLAKQDVLIRVYVAALRDNTGKPRIWRQFRVSAGIQLNTFQDKVLSPIMGWVRNFHCYTFTDFRDGSLYGPEDSTSIDRMHIAQVGYDFLPDEKYKLAHLFGKEGDRIGYLYDFGDKWFHNIEIEKIYPVEESDGEIVVFRGHGMCPGENMNGSLKYAQFLQEYEKGTVSEKYKKKKEILECPNYKAFGKPPSQFDPFSFDIDAARERLADALGTTGSVRSGAKQFQMPIAPDADLITQRLAAKSLKKGQKIVMNYDDENWGYWRETSSSARDHQREAICASCGKPSSKNVELKKCSGCRQVMYCSSEHQKAHWKAAHKRTCTREFVQETAAAA